MPKTIITLHDSEILPVFDGHVFRAIAESGNTKIVIEIPIPDSDKYQMLDKFKQLLESSDAKN